jgi:hypothetical protein
LGLWNGAKAISLITFIKLHYGGGHNAVRYSVDESSRGN